MPTIEIKKEKIIKFSPKELLKMPNGDYRGYLGDRATYDYFVKANELILLICERKVTSKEWEKGLYVLTEKNLSELAANYNIRPSNKKIRIVIE